MTRPDLKTPEPEVKGVTDASLLSLFPLFFIHDLGVRLHGVIDKEKKVAAGRSEATGGVGAADSPETAENQGSLRGAGERAHVPDH